MQVTLRSNFLGCVVESIINQFYLQIRHKQIITKIEEQLRKEIEVKSGLEKEKKHLELDRSELSSQLDKKFYEMSNLQSALAEKDSQLKEALSLKEDKSVSFSSFRCFTFCA